MHFKIIRGDAIMLDYIEFSRISYYKEYGRIPTKLYIDYDLFKILRKEVMYLPFGYHTLLYYKNSISILGLIIEFKPWRIEVGE